MKSKLLCAFFLIVYCLLSIVYCHSQSYIRTDSIKVKVNGNFLKMPWVGGHNYCQFSDIDMNFDGIKDIFVFDRTGNKVTAYINGGTPNTVDYYDSTAKYASEFPHLDDWALLRDFNCDGKEDIFTYDMYWGGIKVWRNISSGGNLQFILQTTPVLQSDYPPLAAMNVTWADIPSIADVDGDGDLDILTFGFGNPYPLEYHINKSVEKGYGCDSLIFQLDSNGCWGDFNKESNSCDVNLLNCRMMNPDSSQSSNNMRHPSMHHYARTTMNGGDCSLCLDLDADGDKDVLIGGLACCNMVALNNTGNSLSANMTSIDKNFPSNNIPVNITAFPCGYFLDLNNDNKRDLVVCPNVPNFSIDNESVWYYKNIGTDNAPVFSRQTKSILQEDMIDVGSGSDPVFFDFDNNGLTDLLISNYSMVSDTSCSSTSASNVYAFKNIGTSVNPMFELINTDFANLSSQLPAYSGKHLTFGDLDGDGDTDMFIGDYEGHIHYFENTAGLGTPANFVLTMQNYPDNTSAPIDVGNNATPQLIDIDRDGDLDLIIGEQYGNLNYYKNTGTSSLPSFTLITNSFGGVDVLKPCCTGYSVPFIYDSAGSYRMLVSSEANRNFQNTMGWIWYYKNIDGNLGGNFTVVDSMYQNIWEGTSMTVNGKDINGDGRMDLVVGNYCGGAALYMGDTLTTGIVELNKEVFDFVIYPNPSNGKFNLKINHPFTDGLKMKDIQLYNLWGEKIYPAAPFQNNSFSNFQIDLSSQPNGIYFFKVTGENSTKTKKIVIQK